VVPLGHGRGQDEWADLRPAFRLMQRGRPVMIAGVIMVIAQVVWRWQFLRHMYFLRVDFFNLDFAKESGLSWHYLTYIGSGRLVIGERAIIWVLARISFYSWNLAMVVTLAFVLAAGLAAIKALRTLFGERPAILLLLAIYLLIPLTVAGTGWWADALESIPLQLATFMAVSAQVLYIRTSERRHLVAAALWVAFGMIFFEKGLVLPVLLFAVSAFVGPGGQPQARFWLSNARRVFARYWPAWALYLVLIGVYSVVLISALHTSFVKPHAPASFQSVTTFTWGLVKSSLLPATLGGPWHWLPLPGNWYALAAAPKAFQWVALGAAAAVVVVSILRRRVAWRAWAILAGWLVIADMLPVIISTLDFYTTLRALDTDYVADAVPVLVICLGLALLPLAEPQAAAAGSAKAAGVVSAQRRSRSGIEQAWLSVAAALLAVFAVGSIWSVQAYSRLTTGLPSSIYIAFSSLAIKQAPQGAPVLDGSVPADVSYQSVDASASRVVGDIEPGKLNWIEHPNGTIDGLRMFAPDGELDQVWVYGASSGPGPVHGCWPNRHGKIRVKFLENTPFLTSLIRIGYIGNGAGPGVVYVHFGHLVKSLTLKPGLHTAYMQVTGAVPRMSFTSAVPGTCVGDVEAGNPGPAKPGHALTGS
jgi:hypothetical protein